MMEAFGKLRVGDEIQFFVPTPLEPEEKQPLETPGGAREGPGERLAEPGRSPAPPGGRHR